MAGNPGWNEEQKHPGEIKRQGDTCQDADAAEVEGVPGDGEDACGDELAGWVARVSGLAVTGKLPASQDDDDHPQDDEGGSGSEYDRCEVPVRQREGQDQLQSDGDKKWNTKDHFEDLPSVLMGNFHGYTSSLDQTGFKDLSGLLGRAGKDAGREQ